MYLNAGNVVMNEKMELLQGRLRDILFFGLLLMIIHK